MALEAKAKFCTPRECAESVDAAIRRDGGPLEKAWQRIA